MSLFDVFNISGSAMSAQSQRLNVVASNLANADSVTSSDGQPYKSKQVVFTAVQVGNDNATGVQVQQVVDDPGPPQLVYKPGHPLADKDGYVAMPNVNVVDEMVNMISASRSYQTNVDTVNAARTMLSKALTIGQ
jgi:flagellar basal-body rod protein FlgC